ncbi:nucleotidyltransferase family protein [Mangrovicoccus ximenensis]|uniref:hypothetical protein n=1 Tax=Mangrovicoccus ximenensis TaxID=1911570 RepID=UPI00191BDC1D|nr:hypothetical protein [Mangrovicoccus ximenensis]
MSPDSRPLSNRATAAYADLLRLLRDDAIGEIIGTPQRVVRGTRAYWYDAYRLGGASTKRYLGEESAGLLARIEAWRELRDARAERGLRRAGRRLPSDAGRRGGVLPAVRRQHRHAETDPAHP